MRKPPKHGNGRTSRGVADRLTQEQRLRICQLLAEFYQPTEIIAKLVEEFQIAPPHESLIVFYRKSPKWRPFIDQARGDLANRIHEIGVANKTYRLRILHEEILKAREAYLSGETKSGTLLYKQDRAALAAMVRLAAEEMGELRQLVDFGPQEHIFRIVEGPLEAKK